jgi:hypothetical protein
MTANGLKCSFCGKPAADVAKLVAGRDAHICETCVADAAHIMQLPDPPTAPLYARVRSTWSALVERIRRALWLVSRAPAASSQPAPDIA